LWWPIKGISGEGKPIWKRSEARIKGGIPLFLVGVDDAKGAVYAALSKDEPGPNYVHLPIAFHPDRQEGEHQRLVRESLKRLTAEKCLVTVDKLGFQERKWTKPEGARNEEFDCTVYNLAARRSLAADDATIAARLDSWSRPEEAELDAAAIARALKRGRR
jgi:phage terminase large subunit GpA-like protein